MGDFLESITNHNKIFNRVYKAIHKYLDKKQHLNEGENDVYQLIELLNTIEKDGGAITDSWLRDQIVGWVSSERQFCDQIKDEFRVQFGQKLNRRFAEIDKKIQGQFPLLRVGLYTIKFDFEFGEAILFFGPEIERIETGIPLSAESVYRKLTAFDEKLKTTPFDNNIFRQDLIKAYQRLLKLNGKSAGEKLPILKVLTEYVFLKQSKKFLTDPQLDNFRGLSRIELAYNLYRFKESGMADSGIQLHVATFDATTDKANALWIPDNEDGEGTHYAYISVNNDRLPQ